MTLMFNCKYKYSSVALNIYALSQIEYVFIIINNFNGYCTTLEQIYEESRPNVRGWNSIVITFDRGVNVICVCKL